MKAPAAMIEFVEAEAQGRTVPPPGGTHAQIPSQPPAGVTSQSPTSAVHGKKYGG